MIKTGSIKKVRQLAADAKADGKKVGLVPTMGAFHEGHLSLIKKAVKTADFVVVSIFVNPTQFLPSEDYHLYPREIKKDTEMADELGVDVVFVPTAEKMYPRGFSSFVKIEEITDILEGEVRASHFKGVTTIVAKLFNIVQPDTAYFGQKDAQQLAVVKKMVAELNYPVKVAVCPTMRDEHGVALSSRHQYLSESQLKKARGIYAALQEGSKMIKSGVFDFGRVRRRIYDVLNTYGIKRVDYVSFNQWDSLEPVRKPGGKVLISLAVRLGTTRLIDNIIMNFKQ